MSLPNEEMKKVVKLANNSGAMSFVYSVEGLTQGALISVRLEAKTIIYFNRTAWHSKDIKFRPGFFKIVKTYE